MTQQDRRLVRAVRQALQGVLVALTCGVAFGAAPAAPATPADGPPVAESPAASDEVQEVVVTGIRAAISNAVHMKENSDDIIEALSAEDLGKLPDISIADSLARLPGLAAQRTNGVSDYISIRGFGPDFSGTTLGGREQASTGENRGVEFDQYPAELISAVEVYKTPDATLIGQGLAGTVNLETVKPLSYSGLTVALNARAQYNSNGDVNPGQGISAFGSRVSLSVVDQFFDHTLGVAFGIARLDSPIQEKQFQAWYWGQNNGPAGSGAYNICCGGMVVPGDPELAVSDEGMQLRAQSEGSVRTGAMGVVEWAPNDAYHSQLDLFFSNFDEPLYLNGLQWSSGPFGDNISYQNPQLTSEGDYNVLTGGTLNGVKPILENEYTDTGTRSYSIGWNNRVKAGGWTFIGDLSYSTAHVSVHDEYAFTGPQSVILNGTTFQVPISGGYPTFTLPAGVNLADPSQVGFTDPDNYTYDGREEVDHQSDTIKAVRFDVVHPLGWIFKDVDVGFDYSERRKVKSAAVDFAYLNGNGCSTSGVPGCAQYVNTQYTPINSNLLYPPTSLGYGGIPGIVDYNVVNALASQFYLEPDMGTNDYNRNYTVDEKVPLGYVKLDIGTSLAGVPIRGNAGVQFVHTDQSSTALVTDPTTQQPTGTVEAGTSYNEVLPSLNLVGQLTDHDILRLGAAKEMQRPRIDDEKAAASASVTPTTGQWSGSGGNPYLKPYIAISEDISYERIFGKASYASVALFNKNLTTYVFDQTVPNFNFAGYTSPIKANSLFGPFTTPENGSGAKIQGYELTLVLEGNLFARWLDGFGLQSNFAYTDNEIPAARLSLVEGGPPTFPGLSKRVAAATLYYEKYGVSIRVAETYRSDFTGEVTSNFDQIGYTLIAGETTTNLQAGYAFSTGRLNGFTLMLEINNLTNSAYHTLSLATIGGVSVQTPLEYDTFGRTYLLGFNYKL